MKALVIAAHPDDEILGCGGTIAKHIAMGDEVHVLILAEGVTSRVGSKERETKTTEVRQLAREAELANETLGVKSLCLCGFPDNQLDTIPLLEIIKKIEVHIDRLKPGIVYTHHAGDVNIDHRRVYEAAIVALRPLPASSLRALLFFEILSSTEWGTSCSNQPFQPNWFVDITNTIEAKLKAMEKYQSELRNWPHPRSLKGIENLSKLRGATIGVDAAEAFVVGRYIDVNR